MKSIEIKMQKYGKSKTPVEYHNIVNQYISVNNLPYEFLEFNISESSEWNGIHTSMIMECKIHGRFNISINNLKNGKRCAECSKEKVSNSNKMTKEVFLARALKKYDSFYSYDNMNFIKASDKIDITCPIHGNYSVMASKHLSGAECPSCKKEKRLQNREILVINKIQMIHENHFSFDKFVYNGIHNHSTVICNITGNEYQTSPHTLLQGHGCKFCNGQFSYDTISFVDKAKEIHGEKYSYEQTVYNGLENLVKIYCNNHQDYFYIKPSNHIYGKSGCQKCAKYGYQENSPGYFYIQKLSLNNNIFYKFGITGNLQRRITEQVRCSSFEHEYIVELFFEDGSIPKKIEEKIKDTVQTCVVPKELLQSGYTETINEQDLEKVLNIVSEFTK